MQFTVHTDPGHGWLEVPINTLRDLGFKVTDFTRYSYRSEDFMTAYLEEDCDMPLFLEGCRFEVSLVDAPFEVRSFIRSLPRLHS